MSNRATFTIDFQAKYDQVVETINRIKKAYDQMGTSDSGIERQLRQADQVLTAIQKKMIKRPTPGMFTGIENDLSQLQLISKNLNGVLAQTKNMSKIEKLELVDKESAANLAKQLKLLSQYKQKLKEASSESTKQNEKQKIKTEQERIERKQGVLEGRRTTKTKEKDDLIIQKDDIDKNISNLQNQQNEIKNLINLEKELAAIKEKASKADKNIKDLTDKEAGLTKQAKDKGYTVEAIKAMDDETAAAKKIKTLKNDILKTEQSILKAKEESTKLADKEKELTDTKSKAVSSLEDRGIKDFSRQGLESESNRLNEQLISQKGAKKGVEKRIASRETTIGDLDQEINGLIQQQAKLEESYDQFDQNYDQHLQKLKSPIYDELKASLKDLGINLDDIKLDHLSTEADEAAARVSALEQTLESGINEELKDLDNNADMATKEIAELDQEMDDFKASVQDGAEANRRFNDELSKSQAFTSRIKQFFGLENAIQLVRQAVQKAFQDMKELDATITQMAVVTDQDISDYWEQLPEYTARAVELGKSIKEVYQAETLFVQQGLETERAQSLANEAIKMGAIAGLDTADATNKMTAALRGFNMELNELSAQRVNDVYSELAAITAADTGEIANAMTKTASIANSANMEFETTAAFLSQIIETTRESAETAGTAMKTVIARFQELKKDPAEIGEVDGEVVDANKVEAALRTAGVALRDANGEFRALDDVFLELSGKWADLDTNTQRYIATMAAGSRQQSRFIAMMSNHARTTELVNAANNSAGASQEQFEKTLESFESILNRLESAWTSFTSGILDNSVVKGAITALTSLMTIINKATEGANGFGGALSKIGLLFGAFKLAQMAVKKITNLITSSFKEAGQVGGQGIADGVKQGFEKAGITAKEKSKEIGQDAQAGLGKISSAASKMSGAIMGASMGITAMGSLFRELGLDSVADDLENIGGIIMMIGSALMIIPPIISIINLALSTPPIGIIVTILLAVIAALAAIIMYFKAVDASSLENQLKAAEQATANAKEAAEDAKKAYDELLSAKSGYDEVQNKLKKLTYGTEEWKKVLVEANTQVLELLSTYPELAQHLEKGEYGQLTINEAGINAVIDKAAQAKKMADVSIMTAQQNETRIQSEMAKAEAAKMFEIKYAKYNYVNADGYTSFNPGDRETIENGAYDIKYDGEAFESMNNLYRDYQEDFLKLESTISSMTEDELENLKFDKLEIEDFDKNGEFAKKLKEIGENAHLSTEYLAKTTEGIKNYNTRLDEQDTKLKSQARTAITQMASIELISSTYGTAIINSFTQSFANLDIEKEVNEEYEKYNHDSDIDPDNDAVLANENFKILAEKYGLESQMGKDELKNLQTMYKAIYNVSEIPEDIKKDEDALIKAILRQDQQLDFSKTMEDFYKKFENLTKENQRMLAGILSDGGTELTLDFIEQYHSDNDNFDTAKLENMATSMGYESAEAMAKAMGKTYDDLVNEAVNNLNAAAQDLYESEVKASEYGLDVTYNKDMNTAQVTKLTNNLVRVVNASGTEVASSFSEQLNSIMNTMGTEDAQKFADVINSLDWSSQEDWQEFPQLLKDMEITTRMSNKELRQFANRAIEANKAISNLDFSTIIENITQLHNTIKSINIGEQGRKFTKEQYNLIIDELPEFEYEFNLSSDGDYVFRGSLDELISAIENNTNAQLSLKTQELQTSIETAKIINELNSSDDEYRGIIEKIQNGQELELSQQVDFVWEVKKQLFSKGQDVSDLGIGLAEDTMLGIVKEQDPNQITEWVKQLATIYSKKNANEQALEGESIAAHAATRLDKAGGLNAMAVRETGFTWSDDNTAQEKGKIRGTLAGLQTQAIELGINDKVLESYGQLVNILGKIETQEVFVDPENIKLLNRELQKTADLTGNLIGKKQLENTYTTIFEGASEAAEGYKILRNAIGEVDIDSQIAKVSEMASGFNIRVDKSNFEAIGKSFETMLQGGADGYQAYLEMMEYSAYQAGVTADVFSDNLAKTFKSQDDIPQWVKQLANEGKAEIVALGNDTYKFSLLSEQMFNTMIDQSGALMETWKNPYDLLYNLNQSLNSTIRDRTKYEKEYERALTKTGVTAQELNKITKDRVDALKIEAERYGQIARASYNKVANIYGGNTEQFKDFEVSQFQKFVSANVETGEILVDSEAVTAANLDSDTGAKFEEWVGAMQEAMDSGIEAEESLDEMKDVVEDIRDQGKEEASDLYDQIKNGLANLFQSELDKLDTLNQSIKTAQDALVGSIQQQIADARQARQNEKTEQEIVDKQAQLSYLSQDTSGANSLAIASTEQEVADMTESYQDSLVDQAIAEIQAANDHAAEQRQMQIDLAQAQLDTYLKSERIWGDIEQIIQNSLDSSSKSVEELKEQETAIFNQNKTNFDTSTGIWNQIVTNAAETYKQVQSGLGKDGAITTNQALLFAGLGKDVDDLNPIEREEMEKELSNNWATASTYFTGENNDLANELDDSIENNDKLVKDSVEDIGTLGTVTQGMTDFETKVQLEGMKTRNLLVTASAKLNKLNNLNKLTTIGTDIGDTEEGVADIYELIRLIEETSKRHQTAKSELQGLIDKYKLTSEDIFGGGLSKLNSTDKQSWRAAMNNLNTDIYGNSQQNYNSSLFSFHDSSSDTSSEAKETVKKPATATPKTPTQIKTKPVWSATSGGVAILPREVQKGWGIGFSGLKANFKRKEDFSAMWANEYGKLKIGQEAQASTQTKLNNAYGTTAKETFDIGIANNKIYLRNSSGKWFTLSTAEGLDNKTLTSDILTHANNEYQKNTVDTLSSREKIYLFADLDGKPLKFKTGGLADFTGPAWLDGTKSRPEVVLNARQTQDFFQLRDILSDILHGNTTNNSTTTNSGTYDIDINVESIGSDYDVEQLANKIKKLIYNDATYRNINAVSK